MDIEEFYDGDARRRPSAELELGREWHDNHGVNYELNYIEDTGELYVMQEPPPHEWEDPFGGIHLSGKHYEDKLMVRVVAKFESVDALHQAIAGWQDKMSSDGSVEWLAERLRAAGAAVGPDEAAGAS
jgi:hypothetical protein